MSVRDILPSARFTTIVGSIALAAGLIWGTYTYTHYTPPAPPSELAVTQNYSTSDWRKALEDIQAQDPKNRLPEAPDQSSVDRLLNAATSNNVTDTVARTLLINLTNAKAQGLGSDVPTQDDLVADAAARITQERSAPAYAASDLTLASNSQASLKKYGNAFMAAAQPHTEASYDLTLYIIGTSTGNNNPVLLKQQLTLIGKEYAALARDLSRVEVPSNLVPIHLSIINNFKRMSDTYAGMQQIFTDPLRALGSLQLYDALTQETFNLFINIAQELNQNGILFTKDEPGSAWSSLVP
jgi:hypothetical protein